MANFVLVVDGDPERRAGYLRRIVPLLAPLGGLSTGTAVLADFSAVWAAHPAAPISHSIDGGTAAVVWGRALDSHGSIGIDARALSQRWQDAASTPPAFDGYYAAARYRPSAGLTVGGDLLGLFPLYYCAIPSVVLVGSSPELFRFHPLFPVKLDLDGLLEILLIHAPLDNRTLVEGVRRLRPGHLLVWRPGGAPHERPQYEPPAPRPVHPPSGHGDPMVLDAALAAAVHRHAPPDAPRGLLLTGGRDSRMLAGYLHGQNSALQALTWGDRRDYEARCAARVARALGFPHAVVDVPLNRFRWAADLHATWEHLVTGFGTVQWWAAVESSRCLPATVVSGHFLDAVLSRPPADAPSSFQEVFAVVNRSGVAPDLLKRLLRTKTARELVDAVVARAAVAYRNSTPFQAERRWRFQFTHAERFNVGGVPWRLTFASWPILPALDRSVVEAAASLPAASLASRQAQDEILRRRFPGLARLPHVHQNAFVAGPLLPSWASRCRAALSPRLRWLVPGSERRVNYRLSDLNGPGWRAIRALAEPNRDRLAEWFDLGELARFLPPPEAWMEGGQWIVSARGRKLLLGLMLWARDHLE